MSIISEAIRAGLTRAYAAPDRHYHNLTHIETLLGLARQHKNALADTEAVEAAIWFHDAIYDTRRPDNEDRSADLALDHLKGKVTAERLDRIAAMIRATSGHNLPDFSSPGAARDCALFLDMDLAILGAPPDDFEHYAAAVRREYSFVPEPLWVEGRRKVLDQFLARSSIYLSPQFQASHEAAARRNLEHELASLAKARCE
jgi:predicted metal-dependent HD superfamily phosphohydrolase